MRLNGGYRRTLDIHQHVAFTDEIEERCEFRATVARRARHFLGTDDIASSRLECVTLDRQVLICGADPSVAVLHKRFSGVSLGFKLSCSIVSKWEDQPKKDD